MAAGATKGKTGSSTSAKSAAKPKTAPKASKAAQDALGALDLGGFDSIDGQLQELDAGLDE